jgi:hypothetical protein
MSNQRSNPDVNVLEVLMQQFPELCLSTYHDLGALPKVLRFIKHKLVTSGSSFIQSKYSQEDVQIF